MLGAGRTVRFAAQKRTLRLTVLVLAGGASRRMGRDKAAIVYGGQPLLTRTCAIGLQVATEPGDRVIVLSRADQPHGPLIPPGCAHWLEPGADPSGPLVALAWALPQLDGDWVLVLACDMPNLGADRIHQARQRLPTLTSSAYIPRNSKGWEPLCGFYRCDLAESLTQFAQNGGRSFQVWLNELSLDNETDRSVQIWDLPPAMLHNCNRPEDLARPDRS
jgi:molybdenum cofactor guanylyltransferase